MPRATNLREPAFKLIGREAEVRDVTDLVTKHRLVTLVGTGGIGKTRLGLEVARDLLARFPDGVFVAELGPLSSPESGPATVATALGLTLATSREPLRVDGEYVHRVPPLAVPAEDNQDMDDVLRYGAVKLFEADHVIATMPVRSLVRALAPPVPPAVRQAADGLAYRDFLVVALILDKQDLFPDNWIYIHTPGVKVGRNAPMDVAARVERAPGRWR